MSETEKKAQCCERDHNHDGNCDVHPAVEVVRTEVTIKVNPEAKTGKKS